MAGTEVKILDQHGNAMVHKPSRGGIMANMGGYGPWGGGKAPYDSANQESQRMQDWQPYLGSPDNDLNPWRDRIAARSRDIVRNDGWSAGVVSRLNDNVIGSSFRPISKPDYRAMQLQTGNKRFDAVWAKEYGSALDASYRLWANDPGHYCDASRQQSMAQIFGLAFRHKIVDGDALATMPYKLGRIGPGQARYATCVQLIDPDRLSNPQQIFDMKQMRGGVKIDHDGAAVAYYIRRAHQGDWYNAADSVTWDLIPRETQFGRSMVVHDFWKQRAGQHRGGAGVLNSVMQKLKMLYTYDGAELDQAIINAIFGAFIKSPFDPELVQSALGNSVIPQYQRDRGDYHRQKNIELGGARIPHLYPGEDFVTVDPKHPSANFAAFQATFLRSVASATGLSYEQVSSDWSQSNYSSARGALIEAWKTMKRMRDDFAIGFAQPIFTCFAEEAFDVDGLPLPSGAPDFVESRMAYSNCLWIGPAKGYIDPVKEKNGSIIGMEAGLSTLEQEAAENGNNWEDVLDQRKIENDRFTELGLSLPEWLEEIDQVTAVEKTG